MDIIHLLPDSVANQIAAGEVIQRPSSCLKELVENSLDAGATHIQIVVVDAGRTMLQVVDNGSGMSATDARLAFERHATSKIRTAADLFSLHTMGFRGEALASICAVAQVVLTTRREEDEVGTLLEINGSEVVRQEPCQCQVGTNMKVRNLFYNVPARRRFLKKDATEMRQLLQDFYRIALVYPKVAFTLLDNDEVVLDLPVGTYKQRIEQIFQRNTRRQFCDQLIDVKVNTQIVNIYGFIGKPEGAQKGNPQYFFVNGRYMRHPYFHKAVLNAYTGMLQGEQQPAYFLYFDIAPEAIDVNIHPTKTEIKFADEQSIFQILSAAVREAIGKFNVSPSIDFDREGDYESAPVRGNAVPTSLSITANREYNPFKTRQTPPANWERLYRTPDTTPINNVSAPIEPEPMLDLQLDPQVTITAESVMQFDDRYIFCAQPSSVLVVDRYLAHVNVLYNVFSRRFEDSTSCSQQLLFPDTIDLSADDARLLNSALDDFRSLGFDIDAIGPESFVINGVPSELGEQNDVRTLLDMIAELSEASDVREQWHRRMALALARKVAVPNGKRLSADECVDLLTRLLRLPTPAFTPDGKRIVTTLSAKDIAALF